MAVSVVFLSTTIQGLATAQQPQHTVLSSVDCPVCTAAQWARWRETYLHSGQIAGKDVLGHRIGLNHARTHTGGTKWRVVDVTKQTVCGPLQSFGIGDYPGPEFDWSLPVRPSSAFKPLLDQAASIAVLVDDSKTASGWITKWSGLIKGEITVDSDLRHNEFFFGPTKDEARSELADYKWPICLYGPLVLDLGHSNHPEIHPAELVWWRDRNSMWLWLLQDDSNRYDRDWYDDHAESLLESVLALGSAEIAAAAIWAFQQIDPYQVRWSKNDPANWSRPWSAPPRWAEFRVAFKADPTATAPTQYEIHELFARRIRTASNDSASVDSDNGTDHTLQYQGKSLIRVVEDATGAETVTALGVKFVDICRTAPGQGLNSAIIGFIALNSVVGTNDRGGEGYHVLRIDKSGPPVLVFPETTWEDIQNRLQIAKKMSANLLIREIFAVAPGFRFRIPASTVRRSGQELVGDVVIESDSVITRFPSIHRAIWRSGRDSLEVAPKSRARTRQAPSATQVLLASGVSLTRDGTVTFYGDSGRSYEWRAFRIALAPTARATPAEFRPSSSASEPFATLVDSTGRLKSLPGQVVGSRSWDLELEPAYSPMEDAAAAPDEESEVTAFLNTGLRFAETGQAPKLLPKLFGTARPFRVDWQFAARNLSTERTVAVDSACSGRADCVRVRSTDTQLGRMKVRVDFPATDSIYELVAKVRVRDPFGLEGRTQHIIVSHHIAAGASETLRARIAGRAAEIAGVTTDSLLLVTPLEFLPDTADSQLPRRRSINTLSIMIASATEDSAVTLQELRAILRTAVAVRNRSPESPRQ